MLGARAALGRLLDDNDEKSTSVCVISYDLWQRRFGGREDVIGQTVRVNNQPVEIVGVAMPGFRGAALHRPADLQMPAAMADKMHGPNSGWAEILAKLKPGVNRAQAEARVNSLGREIEKSWGLNIAPQDDIFFRDGSQGFNSRREQYATPVLVLFLLVAVVLLVACCNLTALLLARGVERSREAGMRLAIGASRGSLVRQFLTESLILAGVGGAAGWFVALAANKVLLHILDSDSTGLTTTSAPDRAVFLFCLAITLLTGLLFGILPAWRAAQADPLTAIHGGSNREGAARSAASRVLIAAQMALSLALLFGAGLFAQTLRNLHSINLGFSQQNLTLILIDHSSAPQGAPAFFDELLRRSRELPEVRSASLSSISALSGSILAFSLRMPGASGNALQTAFASNVSPGYLQTLGIPLLAGRDLDASDRGAAETPVIVNQQLATQYFAGDALGKTFSFGGRTPARIVGIAGTAKYRFLREDPQPMFYLPLSALPARFPATLFLQIRTDAPDAAIARVRTLIKTIDSSASIDSVATMAEQIDHGLARERMLALLSTVLGGVSVFLAAMGLYGVLAFSVARRTREIGIRMAVGAGRGGILAMVLRDGAWIVLAGTVAGVPLALGCGRLASSLLYGLKAQDAMTAVVAMLAMAMVALAASLIPAWRAARVDPMTALRNE
jgi:predicted permease